MGKGLGQATIKATEGGAGTVKAQYNPKSLTVTKSVTWNQHKGAATDVPGVQFTTGQPKKLSVELFFDGYEANASVRGDCQKLIKMAEMDTGLHRPPEVEFKYGEETFKGVLDNVSVNYTMFLSDGKPCRATVSLSMQNADPKRAPAPGQETQSPDYAKLHTLRRGETLHHLAFKEYDDAAEWRRIADANGIDDPLAVEPGTKLLVPAIIS